MFSFSTINNNFEFLYAIFHPEIKNALGKFISALCYNNTYEVFKARTPVQGENLYVPGRCSNQTIYIHFGCTRSCTVHPGIHSRSQLVIKQCISSKGHLEMKQRTPQVCFEYF